MRPGPDPARRGISPTAHPANGFTLIELLVVIAVLAALTTLAVVRWRSDSPDEQVRDGIDRLAETLQRQCQAAVLEARPRALRFEREQAEPLQWQQLEWQPAGPPQTFPDGAQVRVDVEGESGADGIVCDAAGRWTPFTVVVRLDAAQARLTGDAAGRLHRE